MDYLGRICGLLFCNRCCSYEPQAKLAGFSESNIRLCAYCSSTLLKLPKPTSLPAATSSIPPYLLSTSQTDHPQQVPQQGQPYSQEILSPDGAFNADHFSLSKPSHDSLLLTVDSEPAQNSTEDTLTNADTDSKTSPQGPSQQRKSNNFNLKSLFNELFRTSHGLQMRKQRHRFSIIECISGKEIVEWLIKHQRASVLTEAKLFCQCFLNETYLEPVVSPGTSFVEFKPDQTLYKFGKVKSLL